MDDLDLRKPFEDMFSNTLKRYYEDASLLNVNDEGIYISIGVQVCYNVFMLSYEKGYEDGLNNHYCNVGNRWEFEEEYMEEAKKRKISVSKYLFERHEITETLLDQSISKLITWYVESVWQGYDKGSEEGYADYQTLKQHEDAQTFYDYKFFHGGWL